ncbi:MAG: transketolase [Candidatus Jacksonbacteria bacterium]|jgi:transketolase|nr:transketolase [Candidatus Jacksonbacteria bacterium]MBT6034398.1 transketolase [Candidatus Jacksonbacteria bacterium]MBT6300916.1 transketolase [Candidatus Jacksonbacteria bacterium]
MHIPEKLDKKANEIRQDIIKMLVDAGSGHSSGPLGMADVFTALYFSVLKKRPKSPWWEGRDRVILSNGHICPVWYVALAHAGYFPKSELSTLRELNSRLQGHPHYRSLPGVENAAGPLGQGISMAAGIAYAGLMERKKYNVYCLMGDGELNEGQCWEAFMFAGKYRLHNLTVIVDRNNIQIDGNTEDVMPLEPLRERFESFGFHVIEIDGHNIPHIVDACNMAKAIVEKPTVLLAHTIPGKGVDFMEYNYEWHGKPPNTKEAKKALQDLRTLGGRVNVGDCD